MRFVNPFGPLALAPEDGERLADVARVFLSDGVRRYEQHMNQRRRQLDSRQWRLAKQRDGVCVYAERPPEERKALGFAVGQETCGDVKTRDGAAAAAPVPPPELPVVLVVGTFDGTLDDALYGVVAPTVDAMRVHASYVNDCVVDAAVLATIVEPTVDTPFRSLTLKWVELEQPKLLSLSRNRDFVYIEATGETTLSNGERVGYRLMHSISMAQAPELDNRVRGSMSVCEIFRQQTYSTVDVFVRAVLQPGGKMKRAVVVKTAADILGAVFKNVECGRRKKMSWLIKTRRGASRQTIQKLLSSSRHSTEILVPVLAEAELESCVSCRISTGRMSFSGPGGTAASNKRRCRLCLNYVCNSCRVKKTLSFVSIDGQLLQPELRFCAGCVSDSQTADAYAVAKEEVSIGRRFTDPRVYLSPESSAYSDC